MTIFNEDIILGEKRGAYLTLIFKLPQVLGRISSSTVSSPNIQLVLRLHERLIYVINLQKNSGRDVVQVMW